MSEARVRRGDPLFDEDWDDTRAGYRYECSCGFKSRVMKHPMGAENQGLMHRAQAHESEDSESQTSNS